MERRQFLGSLPIAAGASLLTAAALKSGPAAAQDAPSSTWEQVTSSGTLRVGAALLEPWYFKDTTNSDAPGGVAIDGTTWRGICPSIAAAVAEAMGVRLQIVETTWGNAVAGLQANQYDAMFMLDATPARAMSVDFVPTPMLWYPMSIITGDDTAIESWSELNSPNFTIGVAMGTNSDELITEIAPNATISRFQNSAEIFAAFQSGRINAGVISAIASDLARARMGVGKTMVLKPVVSVAGGVAVRKEADTRWINFLNTCAAYYYNTGTVQQFYNDFLAFRDINPATAVPVIRELW